MKQKGRARYYDRLTPEERFRLDVLATARGMWRSPSFCCAPVSGRPTP